MTPIEILNQAERDYSYIANIRENFKPDGTDIEDFAKSYMQRNDMTSGLCLYCNRKSDAIDFLGFAGDRTELGGHIKEILLAGSETGSSTSRSWWCPPVYAVSYYTLDNLIKTAILPRLELISILKSKLGQ